MNKTTIGWCDFTANLIRYKDEDDQMVWGCERISPGCAACYAADLAVRYGRGRGEFTKAEMATYTPYFEVKEARKILNARVVGGKPVKGSKVFIGDMTDVFGEWVPDELLDKLFAVMGLRHDVTFQVLTKRPERALSYLKTLGRHHEVDRVSLAAKAMQPNGSGFFYSLGNEGWYLPNVWIGTSTENQHWFDIRWPILQQIPAATIFLSVEPQLGWMDMRKALGITWTYSTPGGGDIPIPPTVGGWWNDLGTQAGDPRRVDWVIVGPESGADRREIPIEMVLSVVEQCKTAGRPCYVKQDGAFKSGQQGRIPDDVWAIKQFPEAA